MKAIVQHTFGRPDSPGVLELREVDKPALTDDGVLVRVRAAALNAADWHLLTAPLLGRLLFGMGLRKPKRAVPGTDFAGTVEAVGSAVTDFRPGDEVFGGRSGAFAEYVCVRRAVARKPANATFEQAAAVPVAAVTALQGLRDHGQIQEGQKVLINGASGGVGTFAVQIAKALGAEVTAVCSTSKVELVQSLGADRVIDYTDDDFTRTGERYDLLLDIAGSRSWREYKRVLADDGTFVGAGIAGVKGNRLLGPLGHIVAMRAATLGARQKVALLWIAKLVREDLAVLRDLIEAGKVTPVIDRTYPLADAPAALSYLGEGHARGKVAIAV